MVLPLGLFRPRQKLGFCYKEELRKILGRHSHCLPGAIQPKNKEKAYTLKVEMNIQVFL